MCIIILIVVAKMDVTPSEPMQALGCDDKESDTLRKANSHFKRFYPEYQQRNMDPSSTDGVELENILEHISIIFIIIYRNIIFIRFLIWYRSYQVYFFRIVLFMN